MWYSHCHVDPERRRVPHLHHPLRRLLLARGLGPACDQRGRGEFLHFYVFLCTRNCINTKNPSWFFSPQISPSSCQDLSAVCGDRNSSVKSFVPSPFSPSWKSRFVDPCGGGRTRCRRKRDWRRRPAQILRHSHGARRRKGVADPPSPPPSCCGPKFLPPPPPAHAQASDQTDRGS